MPWNVCIVEPRTVSNGAFSVMERRSIIVNPATSVMPTLEEFEYQEKLLEYQTKKKQYHHDKRVYDLKMRIYKVKKWEYDKEMKEYRENYDCASDPNCT